VLVQDKFHRERVVDALTERGVNARAVDRGRPPSGRVLVLTIHRVKGMEFARVILTGAGTRSPAEQARLASLDETDRADADLRARSLAYVAVTRARDELVVVRRSGTPHTNHASRCGHHVAKLDGEIAIGDKMYSGWRAHPACKAGHP
jgi:superfamily I DNA/RNA helicase